MSVKPSMIIRTPEPGEYEQVITCIREARGSYYYDACYYDIDYLRGGGHEFFAAFNEDGEMMGVTGLSVAPFESEKTTLSILNIRPSYTGRGIATGLLTYSTELLEARGAQSVKGYTVTRYPSIQRVLENLGLIPTGVLTGIRNGYNATPVIHGKCALAIYARSFTIQETGTLYVHTDAAGLAAKVYFDLGIKAEFKAAGKYGKSNVINHYHDAHDDVLLIQVTQSGCGLIESLGELARQYRHSPQHLSCAPSGRSSCPDNNCGGYSSLAELVFLSLNDPSAIYGYESLRDAGYHFCGFDPLGEFEHAVFFKGNIRSVKSEMTVCLASLISEVNEVGYRDHA